MQRLSSVLVCACLAAALAAQEKTPASCRFEAGGDLDKIEWVRPFTVAQQRAKEAGRVLLVKPILGGGNKPAPGGVPCGGKNDNEGSW